MVQNAFLGDAHVAGEAFFVFSAEGLLASGSVMSLRGFPGHRRGPQGRSPSRLRVVMLLAAGLALGLWATPMRGAMTEPESGGAAAAQAKNEQPEPQTPHEAGEKKADAEQPSPAAPPPSAPTIAVQPTAAATGRTPADETPALTAENLLRPFGYAFFANAPETFAPIPDTAVPRDYLLAPGDKLRITFWSVIGQETTLEPTVDPRGQVHVPLLGLVTASGVTLEDFERKLLAGLRHNFAHVEGQVTLASLRSLRVLVAGEATRPGAYTVSSLSTAFNVLYLAGGPNERGSMRSIRLLRGNREVGVIDLYEFLLTGKRTRDYRLVAGDTLFIPVADKLVGIRGEVRRPALYELRPDESLADLVAMAGGIQPATYVRRLQIERIQEHERRIVLDFDLARVLDPQPGDGAVELLDGDIVTIHRVLDQRMNTVELTGQVARPGVYELKPGMRVSDLVEAAQGLRGETYMERAEILRTNGDSTVTLIAFNLEQALDGGEDPPLERWDRVLIYPPDHVRDPRVVSVTGQVRSAGTFARREHMRVSDLIFAAGGLRAEAYLARANLVRADGDGARVTIAVDLAAALAGADGADVALTDGDQLVVYSQGEVAWRERAVSVGGAVQRPGAYERTEGMTLKDLLFAAGGPLPDAFLARANLTRRLPDEKKETIALDLQAILAGRGEDLELHDRDQLLVYHQREVAWRDRAVTIEGAVQRPAAYERTEDMTLSDLLFQAGGLLPEAAAWAEVARARGVHGTAIIIADLNRVRAGGSADDILLHDGDRVLVPEVGQYQRAPRTVRIAGEVRFPGAYALEGRGETLGHLLRRAGGVTDDAFVTGAVFIRRIGNMVTDYQEQIARQVQAKAEARAQLQYQLELAKAARGAAPLLPSPGPSAPVTPAPSAASAVAVAAPEKLGELISSGRVPIDLSAVIAAPGEPADVVLEDGDMLIVPRRPRTVLVSGAAVSPGAVFFEPGKPVDYYVERTGGYDEDANRGRVVVLRADGTVLRRDLVKQVEVGDIIVIPSRPVILRDRDTWGEVGKVLSATANAAMAFYLIREVR
jgi:protein involved in polysaccharide export with SLBB domain